VNCCCLWKKQSDGAVVAVDARVGFDVAIAEAVVGVVAFAFEINVVVVAVAASMMMENQERRIEEEEGEDYYYCLSECAEEGTFVAGAVETW